MKFNLFICGFVFLLSEEGLSKHRQIHKYFRGQSSHIIKPNSQPLKTDKDYDRSTKMLKFMSSYGRTMEKGREPQDGKLTDELASDKKKMGKFGDDIRQHERKRPHRKDDHERGICQGHPDFR